MKHYLRYIAILAILLAAGIFCSPPGGGADTHRERFFRQEPGFQKLVETLQADPVARCKLGHTVSWKAFSNPTKKWLQQLGITHVHLHEEGRHMDLKTRWFPSAPFYLCYRGQATGERELAREEGGPVIQALTEMLGSRQHVGGDASASPLTFRAAGRTKS